MVNSPSLKKFFDETRIGNRGYDDFCVNKVVLNVKDSLNVLGPRRDQALKTWHQSDMSAVNCQNSSRTVINNNVNHWIIGKLFCTIM